MTRAARQRAAAPEARSGRKASPSKAPREKHARVGSAFEGRCKRWCRARVSSRSIKPVNVDGHLHQLRPVLPQRRRARAVPGGSQGRGRSSLRNRSGLPCHALLGVDIGNDPSTTFLPSEVALAEPEQVATRQQCISAVSLRMMKPLLIQSAQPPRRRTPIKASGRRNVGRKGTPRTESIIALTPRHCRLQPSTRSSTQLQRGSCA